MYGMYVHIKAVTYLNFPNKQDFFTKVYQTVQEELSNTYLLLLYAPIMFVMY